MKIKKIISLLLSLLILVGMITNVVMAEEFMVENDRKEAIDVYEIISAGIGTSTAYLEEQLADLHSGDGVSYGFEWHVIAMLRAGKGIDTDILAQYYDSVVTEIKTWGSDIKPTDIERTALVLTVMGKDITDIDGVNLAESILNSDRLTEGSNELAYALIALDAAKIEIPDSAEWSREKIITELLKLQTENGGFGLSDNESSDVDMTAICMQALAPYQNNEVIKEAIDKALVYLKDAISEDFNYFNNVNSTSQVLLALATLDVDVTNPENGFGEVYCNLITAIDEYRNLDGSGYLYGDRVNAMATVQVMQAYDAYRKAHKEDISYWDFSTVGKTYNDEITDSDSSSEEDETTSATVYVTIASEGSIVKDKNDAYVAQVPVTVTDLNDDGILTVDEALYIAHETYYQGGAEAGYNSYIGPYGLSLGVLWGKGTPGTSATAGYWLNNASCWSLEDTVVDGDYLTAFNYYDTIYWSDTYSCFSENEVLVKKGSSVTLTLNAAGYDAEWNTVFSPHKGAKVVFLGSNNSSQKIFTTNKKGQVKITFNKSSTVGSYYVMAYSDDGIIVPTVCKINVTGSDSSDGGSTSQDISVYIKVADPKGTTYMKKTAYSVEKGTSVYELLQSTGLDIGVTHTAYGIYIKSIEGLEEFDEGAKSGWMYRVNGKFPNYSAASYSLSKGDYVEWLYTRDFGNDIGERSYSSSTGTSDKKEEKKEEIADNTEKTVFTGTTFTDVSENDWHYESVKYVYERGLMQGTGSGFESESKMSRAMLVTVLYRMANPESAEETHSFADVPEGQWYSDAVAWAATNRIVSGITSTEFAPDSDISREQMALIIYRFAQMQGYDISVKADISDFADIHDVSDWALDALSWANKSELVNGTSETTLSPKATATRAQVATILMRFCETLAK